MTKILWLYSSKGTPINYNHWFHMDFVRILKERKDVQVMPYGYLLKKYYNDLTPIEWDSKITLKDLKKVFDFDVIIMDNKDRRFKYDSGGSWLPKDFNDFNLTPKILMEGDYHAKAKWHLDGKIDAFILRHKSQFIKCQKDYSLKKCFWLPCSVDTEVFKPNTQYNRKELIFYLGTLNKKVYPYRYEAHKILQEKNLINSGRIFEQAYIKNLQSYICHLSGSSYFHIDPSKNFEIMASGSVLFTNEDNKSGIKDLFPQNSYCTYKSLDSSDVEKKAHKILNDYGYRQSLIQNALKCIKEKHTHQIRARELINIIKQI